MEPKKLEARKLGTENGLGLGHSCPEKFGRMFCEERLGKIGRLCKKKMQKEFESQMLKGKACTDSADFEKARAAFGLTENYRQLIVKDRSTFFE